MSTTNRLLLGLVALLTAGLVLLLFPLLERVNREYFEAMEEPMIDEANLFAVLLEQSVSPAGGLEIRGVKAAFASAHERVFNAQIYQVVKRSVDTQMYVTDQRGQVIFDSDGGKAEGQNYFIRRDVALSLLGEYGARSSRPVPGDANSYLMYVGAPIRWHGRIIGVVSISKPQRSLYEFIAETHRHIVWMALSVFALLGLGAYLIVKRHSRPMELLTAYARRVARGERVAIPQLDSQEVAMLGKAFEEMRDALDGREYIEKYVQTLTHEMKSPVAAIRGASELLREGMPEQHRGRFLANIEAEAQRLQNIIDRLLGLSAIESRKSLEHLESVPLAELTAIVCARFRGAAETRGVRIEFRPAATPSLTGESFLIDLAIANLLQNAIEFSPPGGVIQVGIGCADDAPWVELCIEDEGPGIPDYALPRLFERFYSLRHPSTGRKSSGLGLCLVREAVELHHGVVSIVNRGDRPGARAVLRFPLGSLGEGAARAG